LSWLLLDAAPGVRQATIPACAPPPPGERVEGRDAGSGGSDPCLTRANWHMESTPDDRQAAKTMSESAHLDARAFRAALGEFVTGVTIITTCDAHGVPAGLTANSFNSVSLDPPLVLFSLSLDSANLDTFRQASWWAVHVLAADQEALSNRFARRDAEKFTGVDYARGPGGIPLLDGFSARFICHSAFEYEGGDHAIFLGEVREFEQAGRPPLIYHKGQYGGVLPAGLSGAAESASVDALAEQGLVTFAGARPELTARGRDVAQGFAALAGTHAGFSAHEQAALRGLLGKLMGG
jgi:flavin reductase (DIM6/NTAB) family NADH-FMN oxidoreductase RutF